MPKVQNIIAEATDSKWYVFFLVQCLIEAPLFSMKSLFLFLDIHTHMHTPSNIFLLSIPIAIIVWINLKLSHSAIIFIVHSYLLIASSGVLVNV